MKHVPIILTIVLTALVSTAGMAQPASVDLLQSRSGHILDQLRTGKAAVYRSRETITQHNDDLNWINDTRTRNEYGGGSLHRQYQDVWDGHVFGDWAESVLTEFEYASDGTLSSSVVLNRGESAWVPATRVLYDSQNGVFMQMVDQTYGESDWVNVERTSFTISNDLITASLSESWDGGTWLPTERYTLEEIGDNTVQTFQIPQGAAWVDSVRHVFPGLTISQLYETIEQLAQDFTDYAGVFYGLRIPDVVEQQFVNGEWVNVYRQSTNRTFDVNTSALVYETITNEDWSEGAWLPTSRILIEYTQSEGVEGQPSKTSVQILDEGGWADLFVETYIIQVDIQRIVQATVQADLGEGMADVSRVLIEWTNVPVLDTESDETPRSFELAQNHPNPFNPSTRISFRLSKSENVRLAVYDIRGREVAVIDSGLRPAGEHTVTWDALGQPSGTYLYRLETGGEVQTRTMILVK